MPRPRQQFLSGPYRGMRANWRGPLDEGLAYEIGNMLPVNRLGASPLVAVPPSVVQTGLTTNPPVSDDFGASNSLTAVGHNTEATLDPAAAADNNYTAHFDVTVRVKCPASGSVNAGITLGLWADTGSGYSQIATYPYSASATAEAGSCVTTAYARPNSKVSAVGWTDNGKNTLWEVLDEITADDFTTYASCAAVAGEFKDFTVGLSTIADPGVHTGHALRIRCKASGPFSGTLVVTLKDDGTTIAENFFGLTTYWKTDTFTLTTAQAAAIANYDKLQVFVEAQPELSDDATIYCTWIEFSAPGVATYQATTWTHEQKTIAVAGAGVGDKIKLQVESEQNAADLYSYTVHGYDGTGDPSNGVTYVSGQAVPVQGFGVLQEESYACVNGELYKLAYSTQTWTRKVTTAELGAASITLNTGGPVYFTEFVTPISGTLTPVLVISDGSNVPFYWDGTSTTGAGLKKMVIDNVDPPGGGVDCPVFYGQPTVYYAKLFAIKKDDRRTIVWSEENDLLTGFDVDSGANFWTLSQTGGAPLHCLVGTNQALFYFRDTSIGSIRGPVADDFTASGVHDDISTTIGTTGTRGAALIGDTIWVQDAEGKPWAFRPGEAPQPIWQEIGDYWGRGAGDPAKSNPGDRLRFPFCWVGIDSDDLVACCWEGSATQAGGIVLFDAASRQPLTVFTPGYGDNYVAVGVGYAEATIASVKRRQPVLLVGYPSGACVSWPPLFPGTTSQYDLTNPTRVPTSPWLRVHAGFGSSVRYLWDRATLVLYAGAAVEAAPPAVGAITPYWGVDNVLTVPPAPTTFKFIQFAGLTAGSVQNWNHTASQRRADRLVWGLERESRHLMAAFDGPMGVESVVLEAGVMRADPAHP